MESPLPRNPNLVGKFAYQQGSALQQARAGRFLMWEPFCWLEADW